MYQDRELTIDGLRLHYTEWGDPDAETLLCVGGIMQEAHVWDLFAETMSTVNRSPDSRTVNRACLWTPGNTRPPAATGSHEAEHRSRM